MHLQVVDDSAAFKNHHHSTLLIEEEKPTAKNATLLVCHVGGHQVANHHLLNVMYCLYNIKEVVYFSVTLPLLITFL